MDTVIYGLEDPRDHLFHYIGITDDVYTRFIQHVTGDGRNIEKNGWIWECRQDNIMIIMRELERVEIHDKGLLRESFWITYYLNLGHPLHNLAVAKGILKQKEKLEREYEKILKQNLKQVSTIDQQEQIKAKQDAKRIQDTAKKSAQEALDAQDLEKVVVAWNVGHCSIGKIMAATGLRMNRSRVMISRAKHLSLIQDKAS